jgi:hypothetical protein
VDAALVVVPGRLAVHWVEWSRNRDSKQLEGGRGGREGRGGRGQVAWRSNRVQALHPVVTLI